MSDLSATSRLWLAVVAAREEMTADEIVEYVKGILGES